MRGDESDPTSETPDPVTAHLDPGALKDAHGRTGRLLQNAGLPFEEEEFEEADADETSSSSDGSSEASSDSEE